MADRTTHLVTVLSKDMCKLLTELDPATYDGPQTGQHALERCSMALGYLSCMMQIGYKKCVCDVLNSKTEYFQTMKKMLPKTQGEGRFANDWAYNSGLLKRLIKSLETAEYHQKGSRSMFFGSEPQNSGENTAVFMERKAEIIHSLLHELNQMGKLTDLEYNELVIALEYEFAVGYIFDVSDVDKILTDTNAASDIKIWIGNWDGMTPEFREKWKNVDQWIRQMPTYRLHEDASIFM